MEPGTHESTGPTPLQRVPSRRTAWLSNTWKWIFQIDVSRPLPVIDLSQTVASRLLTPSWSCQYLEWMKGRYANVAFIVRLVLIGVLVSWFVPPRVGQWMTLPIVIVGVPAICAKFLLLQPEILTKLVLHFEFWNATVLNALSCVLVGLLLNDARALTMLVLFGFTELVICLDANYRTMTTTVRTTLLWIPSAAAMVTFCMEEARLAALDASSTKWTTVNMLMNSSLTLAIVVANKTYKRRKLYSHQFAFTKVVPCAIYRSKMHLSRWPSASASMGSMVSARSLARNSDQNRPTFAINPNDGVVVIPHLHSDLRQQVNLIPYQRNLFDTRRTILPSRAPEEPYPGYLCILLYITGIAGLALASMSMSFSLWVDKALSRQMVLIMAVGSLVFTTLFWLAFIVNYQRQLLRLVLRNFDFWFSSGQFVLGSMTLTDLLQWEPYCVSILSWNIWFHWAMLTDAMTPTTRRRLRFRKLMVVPVMAVVLVNATITGYAVLLPKNPMLQDRVIHLGQIADFNVCFHSKSFLFYRLVTVFTWTLRLLYGLVRGEEDELLMIRGSLEYFSPVDVFPPLRLPSTIAPTMPARRSPPASRSPSPSSPLPPTATSTPGKVNNTTGSSAS